ncbi:hypothetical protein WMF20_17540 [Sorangium sp. So ce834]|uniref:hypothetical protein n=1 Tax=Sorangium sp. So ce834 TaxID=3133321 RepID=UPI003F61E755
MDQVARNDEHRAVRAGRHLLEDLGDPLEIRDIALKVGGDDQSAPLREVDDTLHVSSIAERPCLRLARTERERRATPAGC